MVSATTTASDLIVPEVWGPIVGSAIPGQAVMSPFVTDDATLVGQPGDRVTFSKWGFIGEAKDIGELDVIETKKLEMTSSSFGIKEVADGIAITDKSILVNMGNPEDEITRQLALSMARKWDTDARTAAAEIVAANPELGVVASRPLEIDVDGNLTYDAFVDGTSLFGDTWNPADFLGVIIHSKQYADLRKDDDFISADKIGANNSAILTGRVGQLSGVDIVVSDRVKTTGVGVDTKYESLLIRRGAIKRFRKRDVIVEKARDIEARKTIVTTNSHYGVARTDDSGVLVLRTKSSRSLPAV